MNPVVTFLLQIMEKNNESPSFLYCWDMAAIFFPHYSFIVFFRLPIASGFACGKLFGVTVIPLQMESFTTATEFPAIAPLLDCGLNCTGGADYQLPTDFKNLLGSDEHCDARAGAGEQCPRSRWATLAGEKL